MQLSINSGSLQFVHADGVLHPGVKRELGDPHTGAQTRPNKNHRLAQGGLASVVRRLQGCMKVGGFLKLKLR